MRLMWGYDDDSYQTVDVLPERKVLLDSARDGKAFSHEVWHGFRKMPKRARICSALRRIRLTSTTDPSRSTMTLRTCTTACFA